MASSIATGFVRKLYRMLEEEDASIIGWEPTGTHFTIRDEDRLNAQVLLKYYRGKLTAFRQQLLNHGFERDTTTSEQETYYHPCFVRGNPAALSQITFVEKPKIKGPPRKATSKASKDASKGARSEPYPTRKPSNIQIVPGSEEDTVWKFLVNVCYSDDKFAFNPSMLTSNPGFTPSMVQLTIDDPAPPSFDGPNPLFAKTSPPNPLFGAKSSHPSMLPPPFQVIKAAPPPPPQPSTPPAGPSLFAPPISTSRLFGPPGATPLHHPPSTAPSSANTLPHSGGSTTPPSASSSLFQPRAASAPPTLPLAAFPAPPALANPLFQKPASTTSAESTTTNPLFDKSATPTGFGALPAQLPLGLAPPASQPLFQRNNSLGGDQWLHLVSSSVDRFMRFSDTFDTPEDAFKFVLEERQMLEKEKTKLGDATAPAAQVSTSLFNGLANQGPDALISFLMTSSIDQLQKGVETIETIHQQHQADTPDEDDDEWDDGDAEM